MDEFGQICLKEGTDFYEEENKLYLLCDSYSDHFSKDSMKFAQLLIIQLIKIPEGTTDIFQTLDCCIFGVLKNHARTFLNLRIIKELEEKFDIEQAVSFAPIRPLESNY